MIKLMINMKPKFISLLILILLVIFVSICLFSSNGLCYYGMSGLGLYGGYSSLYGGLYGNLGLYGLGSLYGGLMGMYGLMGGMYGLGGLYGGLLGGLYGMYGLGGLYGGLLGGLYGMYGLGGLYGGLGGLYGLGIGGIGGYDMLGTMSVLSTLGLLNPVTQATTQPSPLVVAEQAGGWSGTWYSLFTLKGGIMTLNLTENLVTGILSGQVNMLLHKITSSIPADVAGVIPIGTTFVLTGDNQAFLGTASITTLLLLPSSIPLYSIELNCTLTTPTTMTGTYMINDLLKLDIDYGNFNLTLTAPII